MVKKYDVIISGAGPAGTTCALAMEESGLKVAVIEKSLFPRDKICGDAIAGYVPKVLNTINPKYVELLEQFTEKEIVNKCRLVAPNEKYLDLEFSVNGFISARLDFDNFLYEQAAKLPNVDIFLKTTIIDIEEKEDCILVQTSAEDTLECQLIIGCDGAHSIVSKKLTNTKVDLSHYSGAVRAYYKNVKEIPSKTFELHFIKGILPGYFWIFPLPNNMCNVGLGMLSKSISDNKVNLKAEMLKIIYETPYLKERFKDAEIVTDVKGFGLPLGSRKVTISGNRFMLCGDAASLIDPATGEGIGQAMISGRYAGWQAIMCFEQNNFSAEFMKAYDKTVYDKLWKSNQSRYFIQQIIDNRPWIINAAINLAGRSSFINSLMKKIIW